MCLLPEGNRHTAGRGRQTSFGRWYKMLVNKLFRASKRGIL
jgi:hypothetical protein